MKPTLIFRLSLLTVSLFTFLLHTATADITKWSLPEDAIARFGKGRINEVTYSPDGKLLAVASDVGIWLYDAHSGQALNLITGHKDRAISVRFSPDGQTLAGGGADGYGFLWDVETGDVKHRFTVYVDGVFSVSFSPDGQTLAIGSHTGYVSFWNVQTGARKKRFRRRGDTDKVISMSFNPDGQTLASTDGNRTIRLWDVETGDIKQSFTGHTDSIRSVSFSPDGQTLASSSWDNTVRLWDVETGAEKLTLTGHTDRVNSVSFSPDGQTIASSSDDNTIRLWDVHRGVEKQRFIGHTDSVSSVSFSPDGQTLASSSWDNTVRLWDVQTGIQKKTLTEHMGSVNSVSFSSDGRTIASGSADGTIRLWDRLWGAETGVEKLRLTGRHKGSVYSVSFSPDGKILASSGHDNIVRLWEVQTGVERQSFTGHTDRVSSVSFSPDGKTIATGSDDNTVRLWDVQTGLEKKRFTGDRSKFRSVSFSPDGLTLAGASAAYVRLWDVQTGTLKRRLEAYPVSFISQFTSVSFSPDGKTIVTGDTWGGVTLLDVQTGTEKRIRSEDTYSVSFSPDGKTIATGHDDGTVRLRVGDVQTDPLSLKQKLSGHRDRVNSVSFSPDGRTLASGSADGTVLLWRVMTEPAIVSISPASVPSPAVGEQLELSLKITGGVAVAGYQATLQFDTTTLRYVSGEHGDYLPADAIFVEPIVEGNLVKLNAVSLAGDSNGHGILVTLIFEVIAAKASILTLSEVHLANSVGEKFVANVENTQITEPTGLGAGVNAQRKVDVNGDGIVNIQDLVSVVSNLGQTGENAADVNGDGIVDISDLILVAGVIGNDAAAPSLHPQSLEVIAATDVKRWLSQAQQLNLTDTTSLRGIQFLEQLLAALTPKETALLANYPNPFNPETWIPYQLASPAEVCISIYAADGKLVRTLDLGHQPVGMYQSQSRAAYWDGKNAFGEPVASGVYFYTLTAGDFSATRKMLIRK